MYIYIYIYIYITFVLTYFLLPTSRGKRSDLATNRLLLQNKPIKVHTYCSKLLFK